VDSTDRNAIVELINRYSLAVNHGRDQELKDFYAPGAVFDGLAIFRIDDEFDRYVAYLKSLREGLFPNLRQFLGTSIVSVDGDTAEAFTDVMLLATPHGESTRLMKSGELHDQLIRTVPGWKFVRRTGLIDGA